MLLFMGMALVAFPMLQLEYGKVRTEELLEIVKSENVEKQVNDLSES